MTEQDAIKIFEPIVDHEAYTDSFQDACILAIKALEKQIPKKVVNIDDFADYAECPSCGAIATDNLGCLYKWCRKWLL